jgi:predicted RNA methylase
MITTQTNSENPSLHWGFINCKDKVAIDLGCGRWEHVEYRDPSWPTTPEWLIQLGASKVYAFDIDENEIHWYNTNIAPKMPVEAFCAGITTVDDIRNILNTYNPKVVKCDIEHYERVFLDLTDEEFLSIDFYALETHSDALYDAFIERFNNLGYEVVACVELVHAPPMKALFAEKKIIKK